MPKAGTKYSKAFIISKINSLKGKKENKELVVHSFLSIFARLGGAGAQFVMNIVVARYLGVSDAAYFFLAYTITNILASVARVGADQTILRFIGIHSANNEMPEMNAVMTKMLSWTYLPLILVTILTCVFAGPISVYMFHKPQLQWPLFWTSLSMPFVAGYSVYGNALQGRKRVLWSVATLKIISPVFFIAAVLVFKISDSSKICIIYTISCIVCLIMGFIWWRRIIFPKSKIKIKFDSKVLWQSSYPLWITAIMYQLSTWGGGELIGGAYLKPSDITQLAVARNTTVLIQFILIAINNVSAPHIAQLYSQGKMDELKSYSRNTTVLMTLVALPLTLVVWFFPGLIMSMFGKGFESGIWLLRILAVGQFINIATGCVGTILIMSGHEKEVKNIRIFNGVLAIVLAFILIPTFGAIGSAISSAVSLACFNLMAVGKVKKHLGFSTLSLFGFK